MTASVQPRLFEVISKLSEMDLNMVKMYWYQAFISTLEPGQDPASVWHCSSRVPSLYSTSGTSVFILRLAPSLKLFS
ncbi:hypothetical protein AVEN_190058-1 [Araneus ventricosus]|uniref:Uncharacterized protein n=1 Tax=Araneus ventricosus TaxID=182803 RepID=A0A4Y2MQB1_ARAVE|nr:hypothetical protein AVEN_190058-1 [Araneus ventricosus]